MKPSSEIDRIKNKRFRIVRIQVDLYNELKKQAKGSSFSEFIASLLGFTYQKRGSKSGK